MSVKDKSVKDKLQAVVDEANSTYEAGPSTVNRKLNQVDKVLGAAVEAIQELDESEPQNSDSRTA